MRKDFVLVLLAALPAFSGLLFAQEEKTGFELGVYVAQQNWQPRTFKLGLPQASTPVNLTFQYKDRIAFGTRGNFLSKGHWGGELSYSYQQNTASLSRNSFAPVALDGAIHHFFFNEVFYPVRYARSPVSFFVTGGLGFAAYKLADEARAKAADPTVYGLGTLKTTDMRVALNYGAGVKVAIAQRFGIRGDFRHIFSDVPSYGLPKESANPSQVVLPIQGKLQTYEFSFGIYLRQLLEGF